MIVTEYFRIPPGRYVRQASLIWLGRRGWILGMPLVLLLLCGVWRPIFFVVALAFVLVALPGVLALVYFNHALRPEAAKAVIPHRVTIDFSGVDMDYHPSDEYRTPHPRHIGIEQIDMVEDSGKSIILHLKYSAYDFIEIPATAFSAADFREALNILSTNMA